MVASALAYKKAKWAIRLTFFFMGMSVSVATARMAEIKGNTHSSDSAFGLAVLIGNLGIMLGNLVGSPAVHKIGSRKVIQMAIFGTVATQIGYGFTNHLWQISLIAFTASIFGSFANVGVNMQGGMIETGIGRSLMPSFHGSWTLGAFSASLLTAIFSTHLSLITHLTLNSLFTATFVILTSLSLLPSTIDHKVLAEPQNLSTQSFKSGFFNRAVLLLALAAGLGMLAESSVGEWSSILLHEKYHLSISSAALGFTLFALGQILGRFTVGVRIDRLGIGRVLRAGGLIGGLLYICGPILVRSLHLHSTSTILIVMCALYFLIGICVAPMPPAFAILTYRLPNISSARALSQMQIVGALVFMTGRLMVSSITHLVGLEIALLIPASALFVTGLIAAKIAETPTPKKQHK